MNDFSFHIERKYFLKQLNPMPAGESNKGHCRNLQDRNQKSNMRNQYN